MCPAGESSRESARVGAAEPAPKRQRGYTISSTLFALVAFPLGALLLFVAWDSYHEYEFELDKAYQSANTIRALAARQTAQFLAQSELALSTFARRPKVRSLNPADCDPVLNTMKELRPVFTNVFTLDRAGHVVCSALALGGAATRSPDLSLYFDEVMRTRDFSVGKPEKGLLTGRWVSTLAYPITNDAGETVGVLGAAIDLVRYAPGLPDSDVPPNTVIGIVNDDGVIIARSKDAETRVGVRSDAEGTRAIVEQHEGTVRSTDYQGTARLYSFAPLGDTGWIVYAALDESQVITPALRDALLHVAIVIAIGALIALVTFASARRLARPIQSLSRLMADVGRGDLEVRAVPEGPAELRHIATQFNEMLDARLHAVAALRESEELFRTAFQTSPDSVLITDFETGCCLEVNEGFTKLIGWSREEVLGKRIQDLGGWRDLKDRERLGYLLRRDGGCRELEVDFVTKTGTTFSALLSAQIIHLKGTTCILTVARDVTARKAAEAQIHSLAFYDPLTYLPNRKLFMDRLGQLLAAKSPHQRLGALVFVDLDDFKTLNEAMGHDKGDLLLRAVGERIAAAVRPGDTVAHLGGDDFAVLLEDLSPPPQEAASQARDIAEAILAALGEPYPLGEDRFYRGTSSVGITLLGNQHEDAREPLKRAELAMYRAKSAGRNMLRFYDPEMQEAVTSRAALESALRDAIGKNELLLHYQPQVMDARQIIGAEALVRWQHPERGMVAPGAFIPLAEETGLILPLGEWVLETACRQLAQWAKRPELAPLKIAVNVSSKQFYHEDFVRQVLAVLARTGASPERLELELTESILVEDIDSVIAKMRALKAQGVGFSLDDFGTGYSSLAYLKRLPLDQLKIDRGFVSHILDDANDAAIAKTVISLAESMGLGVIAEGVETELQRVYLAGLNCRSYQGFLFSRPVPISDFEALVLGS